MSEGFLSQLDQAGLARLREVVKRVHMKHFEASQVTDYEADRIIEAIGPDAAEKYIRDQFDAMGFTRKAISGPGLLVPKPNAPTPKKVPKLNLPDGYRIRVTHDGATGESRTDVIDGGRRD